MSNIINNIHDAMNEYLEKHNTRPWYLYLGQKEHDQFLLNQDIFCPTEHQAFVSTTKIFKMEIVIVERNSFFKVG
jgi:hypothetical protein